MSLKVGRPRRPARWYPAGTILTMRDGRQFIVDEQELEYYRENGTLGDADDYLYSLFRKYWRRIG